MYNWVDKVFDVLTAMVMVVIASPIVSLAFGAGSIVGWAMVALLATTFIVAVI